MILSGGQTKLINLVRTIYKNAEILILEDVLNALDIKVVNFALDQCICTYLKGRTWIMIANNLNNIQNVDRIYLLKEGSIVFVGNYWECR